MNNRSNKKSRERILIVDDDYTYCHMLASYLQAEGFETSIAHSLNHALSLVRDSKELYRMAVLDIFLPTEPHTDSLQIEGINLARQLKQLSPFTSIITCSAHIDAETVKRLSAHSDVFLKKPFAVDELLSIITELSNPERGTRRRLRPRILIVHGHDEAAKLALKNYLQNVLNLGTPVILHELPSLGRTIIEKFETASTNVDLVFVLLTPDDIGTSADAPNEKKRRARQNVILELGFFLGKLSRSSGRVILLHKGAIELPSDISGIIYIDITDGIEATGEQIRREISEWLK